MTRLVNHLVTAVFQGKISRILSLSLSLYVHERKEDEEKEERADDKMGP